MNSDLINAIYKRDVNKAIGLVENGADVNAKDEDGFTTLSCAIGLTNDINLVKTLIQHGADVNATNKDGTYALMVAAYNSRNDIIYLLIQSGADYTKKDAEGRTAFDYPKMFSKDTITCICQAVALQQKVRE